MKLPLFKRGGDEQGEIDRMIQENVEKGKEIREEPVEQPRSLDKDEVIRKLTMDVDKLKAQAEAFNQMRQLSEQRFQRISEELGDLRRSSIEREKEMNLVKLEATKASDLVGSVQPEKLMINLEKEKIKIEELTAMHEANKKLISYMADEIKRIKTDIAAFRGAESLIKLNEEIKEELNAIKKAELTVEKHADKVEDIFINLQKKFSDFLKLSDEFKSLQNSFNAVMKDANSFKTDFESLATKNDLAKLEKTVTEKFMPFETLKSDMNKRGREIEELLARANNVCGSVNALENTLKRRTVEIDDTISTLERIDQKKYVTLEKFDEELDEFFRNIIGKLEEHRKELEEKISKIKNGV